MKFKIVVPVYNAEYWIGRCLYTIYNQQHKDWECVVINDASTDQTANVLNSLDFLKDNRFKIVHNKENVKALKNIVDGFDILNSKSEPESVLMVIDGDDFLFSDYTLTIVKQAYEQTGCVLTYGNHIHYPTGLKSNCEEIPIDIVNSRSYRDYKFVTSHLRTFKSKLWNLIKDEDLRQNEKYYEAAWDVAFMMPMLEMAGDKFVFIPNVLYCYNRFNPLSDDVVRPGIQHDIEMEIRSKKRYESCF
jgi:glycosyltransferase involved in cell wall biosynthesis